MKKIVVIFWILSFMFSSVAQAGDVHFYGVMRGTGKQYITYEDRSFTSLIKEFANSPLGWAVAGYLGERIIERTILIPKVWQMKTQEIEMMKIQVEKVKSLSEIEIEKAKRELEFLYSPSDNWQQTPRGKQFLVGLSAQAQPAPTYYFDTGN
ncbi:hypothetical protein J7J41_01425 [bacterium]|nr:hypothetical protein [bacterium]